MITSTPNKIDKSIIDFCRTINSDSKPIYVPVRPTKGSEINECFFNVNRCIESHGGKLLNGWCIWHWPKVFIEAEHHGIWVTEDNTLIDVTPKPQKENKIVFLEDTSFSFNERTFQRTDNIRFNLTSDRDVQAFLDASEEYAAFLKQHSNGRVVNAPAKEMARLEFAKAQALKNLIPRYTKPNDLCPCGSGKKNKKCHRIAMK